MAPYLTLLPEEAGQREHSLREVFNGLRYIIKTGARTRTAANFARSGPLVPRRQVT